MSHLVRAGVLTNYLEVATHLGLNPQAELAAVGLSKAMLQDPEYAIPASAAVELLENSAAHSGCQTFGLRMAESRQLSDIGAVSLLLTHQGTLRDALGVLVQYRHLMNPALAIFVEETGGLAIIREEVVTDTTAPRRQATELALGVMARLCANLLGPHWRPLSVNFVHEAPADLRLHRRLFGCDVVFGAEFNGIACPASLFNAPNPNADPAMARFARRYLDSLEPDHAPSLVFEVRKAIYLLLPMGRDLHRPGGRSAARPGAALHAKSRLFDGAHRRPARLLGAQQLHALVRGRIRRHPGRLAPGQRPAVRTLTRRAPPALSRRQAGTGTVARMKAARSCALIGLANSQPWAYWTPRSRR
jgi:hypothetical protein